MIRRPNALQFRMLLVAAASLFAAEAHSQVQTASKGGSRPVNFGSLSVGAGMDYWSGDWGAADINRFGPTAWVTATIWHCLGVNAEGHSMMAGGNRNASNYKLFVGEGGLTCIVAAWDRFQPIYKGELGFASLTDAGNGTGHLHSTHGTWSFGGGLEIHTRGHWWTRVEYTYDFIPNFHSVISNQNHTLNPRGISFGETFRFGRSGKNLPDSDVIAQETDTPQTNFPGPYSARRTPVEKTPESAPPTATPVEKTPESTTPTATPVGKVPESAPPTAPPVEKTPESATSTAPPVGKTPESAPPTATPVEKVPESAPPTATPVEKVPESTTPTATPVGKTPESAPPTATPVGKTPESATSQFMLGPADVIHVSVWKNTELSQTVTVGPDGFISLPLLNGIHVAGMTANEVAQALSVKLNNYIVNPQVTVSVVSIRSKQVFVLGQVGKPGGYPLVGPIDVLQVIALAGGLSSYAHRDRITILREGKDGTEKIHFNYNNVVRGDGKQNILLQPGDTVVVP